MRINNNISAMNTYSRLNSANNAKSGSLAKLSSGLRINRAGDDAAGLAISEKMRGQIGGLKQATRNAQDGISLIQTAEGGLNETHSILNRMRELAVQSSNDTNTDDDRVEIQKEMNELATEISRISKDTQFNTKNLLGGDFAAKFHIGSNAEQNIDLKISAMDAGSLKVAGVAGASFEVTGTLTDGDFTGGAYNVVKKDDLYELRDTEDKVVATSTDALTYTKVDSDKEIVFEDAVVNGKVVIAGTDAVATATISEDVKLADDTYTVKAGAAGKFAGASEFALVNSKGEMVAKSTDKKEWTNAEGETVLTTITELEDKAKIVVGSEDGIDVSTQAAADSAITAIDAAISSVSAERSKLGATQNRLDHTINNLTATAENLSEAESRIRDVDMAEEMMSFTKNNILSQAATSMLAQANQMPQSVLQLLQ